MESNKVFAIYGDNALYQVSDYICQCYPDTYAVKLQQLVLDRFGIHTSEDDLRAEAMAYGWCTTGRGTSMEDDYEIDDDELLSTDYLEDSDDTVFDSKEDDEFLDEVMNDVHNKNGYEPSFEGSHYTDAEINKLRSEVSRTDMKCHQNDVREWESKVSLNNTKKHIANGIIIMLSVI